MLFGHKSEKVERQVEQLEFKLEELEAASAEQEAAPPMPLETSPSARPSRRPLPEHLPREVQMHLSEQTFCPGCGGALREFGRDVAEIFDTDMEMMLVRLGIEIEKVKMFRVQNPLQFRQGR